MANGDASSDKTHPLATVIRFVPGGRDYVIGLIQRAARNHDAEAITWWKVYSDLGPASQLRVQLDDVCEASGIKPDRLMSIVVSTAMRLGADAADLVAAVTHPTLIRQTAKSAMRIGGSHAKIAQKDREFMLQHHRFIPTPKGTSVHVHASAAAAAGATTQPSVPTFASSLEGAMDAHKALQGELIGETDDD